MTEISNCEDVIDSRDIISRIEELEGERDMTPNWAEECPDESEELVALISLRDEANGSPDWQYGEALIRDSYFETYAQELAEDCGMVNTDASWPLDCIDWERAADALKQDYFSVDFDGAEYWIRS